MADPERFVEAALAAARAVEGEVRAYGFELPEGGLAVAAVLRDGGGLVEVHATLPADAPEVAGALERAVGALAQDAGAQLRRLDAGARG